MYWESLEQRPLVRERCLRSFRSMLRFGMGRGDARRRDGTEEEEEVVVRGRWRGLLAGLRNVNLHFSHLEDRERRDVESGREDRKRVGIKLMDALL